MVDFITLDCNPAGEINFFHSGSYTRSSFSTNWRTTNLPETDGLGTTPVYLQVLSKFNISVDSTGGLPPGGFLPGIDIRNMDAIQAIRLSLSEALISGHWWDIYEDAEGGVRFINVFDNGAPTVTVNLDIRLCIPSSSKDNEVDMVIVTGYKKPPQRYAGQFRDVVPPGAGLVNPTLLTGSEPLFTIDYAELITTCVSSQLRTECTKSYPDPLLDVSGVIGPQEGNPFYEAKAFESLIGWAVDVSGMDEEPDLAARVKYTFSPATTWYQPLTSFPTFLRKETTIAALNCPTGIQSGDTVDYFEGTIQYSSPLFSDRYGTQWPLVVKPAEILYLGYKIDRIVNFGGLGGDGSNFVIVSPIPELNRLNEGSQWVYNVQSPGNYDINMYYQAKIDSDLWEIVLTSLNGPNVTVKLSDGGTVALSESAAGGKDNFNGAVLGVLGGQNNFGYLITDMWLGLTVDRPSVTITDPNGDAREYSDRLHIQYAPLILFDPPAPIAYKHKDFGSVIVDQTVGLQDQDPTTCQAFDERPIQIMQDRSTGNTVEVGLPFCQDAETCLVVAETIFNYQNHGNVQTYTLTCGPADQPVLGAAVAGFETDLRIESISYSFQDSSAYNIEVSLGPVFNGIGSWDNGAWIPQSQDVSRKAIVTYTAGDGVNYRVRIQGLGEMNAINSQQMIWRLGETVDVTVYNMPQER